MSVIFSTASKRQSRDQLNLVAAGLRSHAAVSDRLHVSALLFVVTGRSVPSFFNFPDVSPSTPGEINQPDGIKKG